MSISEMNIKDSSIKEERSCIIISNFKEKEVKLINTCSNFIGVKDKVLLEKLSGDLKLKEIIEENKISGSEELKNYRFIIFNNIPNNRIHIFMENLRKLKINNVLFATVTETSKEWTINYLIDNLVSERKAIKEGREVNH